MQIVVTGAAGTLGSKLWPLLEAAPWCSGATGIDIRPRPEGSRHGSIVADLRDPNDQRWIALVEAADAVVHFATLDPAPASSWASATAAIDMTANLLAHAGRRRPCRFIFASSNHAMGGYKDLPIPGDGKLRMGTEPRAGTRFFLGGGAYSRGAAYGASKLLGERVVGAMAAASGGLLSGVSLRIGYCQRGENRPATLLGSGGGPPQAWHGQPEADQRRDLTWFRNMWLSDGDFRRLLEAALTAETRAWPGPAIVVNGVSANTGMAWDLDEARRWIGYAPQDDVWAGLAGTD